LGSAAELVLILRPGGASWQIEDAEKIAIDKRDRLRVGPSQSTEVRADEYKKLTVLQIARAGVLRRHAAGYLAQRDGNNWQPTAPDGLSLKAATSYAALWDAAQITVEKDRSAKSATSIRAADLFAVLHGSDRDQAVADFLLDDGNFRGLGERNADAAFEERMSLLVAVGPSIKGADGARIRGMLLAEMRTADQKLSSGVARYSDLAHGLKFAAVSLKAFPNDAEQAKARATLSDRKAWLDQRIAILKALAAGELWDAVVDKYGDFDRWDNSFPAVHKLYETAYQESTAVHVAKGKGFLAQQQYDPALREFTIAKQRNPGDTEIERLIQTATIERDGKRAPPPALDPNSTENILIMRHIRSAEQFIDARPPRLKDADEDIQQAEQVNKDAPSILLVRAKWLRASKQFLKALEMLDQYEHRVRKEEWTPAEELRGLIGPELRTAKEDARAAVLKAEGDGDYPAALDAAQRGLALDANDSDFLLRGGLNSAILRKNSEAERLLNQYLRLSQGPGSDAGQREKVYNAVRKVRETVAEPDGVPNWFSGYRSPPGVLYCPISLAFNARVSEVRGSRKQTTFYTWDGDLLKKVSVGSDQPGERPFSAYFEYYSSPPSVRRVATEPMADTGAAPAIPRLTKDGPVGPGTGVYTAMLNLPLVDPLMVEKLTGKRTAAVVAGNAYFHPFAWDGIYLFIVEYDDQGRVASARQVPIAGSPAPATLHKFNFRWDGLRLQEISENESGNYSRTMNYVGGRLSSESISYRNAHPKIDYRYKGDHLVDADCTSDPSLDGRSRQVIFKQP
jgi:hypothetical protein